MREECRDPAFACTHTRSRRFTQRERMMCVRDEAASVIIERKRQLEPQKRQQQWQQEGEGSERRRVTRESERGWGRERQIP